jgi:peptidoglycan hydrolase-like protein with peptidoglycan-binding domain
LSIVLLLSLAVLYAPGYVARYLITSEMDSLGIDYEGVDTLTIDVLKREVWLGPVTLDFGPADRAHLDEVGLVLRFDSLWKRRVDVERMVLRGIDLQVTHRPEREFTLNGIPWRPPAQSPGPYKPAATAAETWEFGVETLEIRDSRIGYRDDEDHELDIELESLVLTDFHSWRPEEAGRFELKAKLNDIALNWTGEARPFSRNKTLAIDSRTLKADVPKLVRLTGPLGLDRRDGTYDAELRYELVLNDSGRFEGQAVGVIDIQGADYERAGIFALAFDRAKVDLDLQYTLSESGDFGVTGRVVAGINAGRSRWGEDARLAADKAELVFSGIEAAYSQEGALSVNLQPDITLDAVDFSGPIDITVANLLDLLTLLQVLSSRADVDFADTGLGDYAGKSLKLPSSDVTIDRLHTDGESLSLHSSEGLVRLDLKAVTDLSGIQIAANESHLEIESLQSRVEQLGLSSGKGRFQVHTAGNSKLVTANGGDPRGLVGLETLDANVHSLELEVKSGVVAVRATADAGTSGLAGRLFATNELPEVDLGVGSMNVVLNDSSLDLDADGLSWMVVSDADARLLKVEFADAQAGVVMFRHADIDGLKMDQRLQLSAAVASVDGLDLYVTRSFLAGRLGPAARSGDKAASIQSSNVRRAQVLLDELGYAPGPVDGLMGPRTAAAIRKFQRAQELAVDGRLTEKLLSTLEAGSAAAPENDIAPTDHQPVTSGGDGSVQIGQLSLTGDSVVRFRDDSVSPQVNIDAVLREAWMRNLDTRRTEQRTDIRLMADVNEFARLELDGWTAGLVENADLELAAKVKNLELVTYAPYIAKFWGAYPEDGKLSSEITATAARGDLEGEIRLNLENIAVRSLSSKDAERAKEQLGISLETAVDLLQDADGRITLALPLLGTLSQPRVDFSSVLDKAIGGIFAEVFPPAMIVSLLADVLKAETPALQPVEFAPGSPVLNEIGRTYLNDLATLLSEHPGVSLKICGRSTAQDMQHHTAKAGRKAPLLDMQVRSMQALDPEQVLDELAIERTRTVRRYLIEDRGIDGARVSECLSTFDADDQGKPRVEIRL